MEQVEELMERLCSADNNEAYAAFKQLHAASAEGPEVAQHLGEFADMLEAESSYVRTRGFLLLVANARHDAEGCIDAAFDRMATCLHDPKPTVVRQCVQSLPELAAAKPALAGHIVAELERVNPGAYRDSMQPLIAADVSDALAAIRGLQHECSHMRVETVEQFRLARYVVISQNPEHDAMDYMERWAKNSGLLDYPDYTPRKIGWDFPFVSEEQKERFGLHGYVAAHIVPDDFVPSCEGAELTVQETDQYAVITITDPFSAPWEKIPRAYAELYEYANAHTMVAQNYENRICMEEVYVKEGVTYMDVYVPVDAH